MEESDKRIEEMNNRVIANWMDYYHKALGKAHFALCKISALLSNGKLSSEGKFEKTMNCIAKYRKGRKELPKPWV